MSKRQSTPENVNLTPEDLRYWKQTQENDQFVDEIEDRRWIPQSVKATP